MRIHAHRLKVVNFFAGPGVGKSTLASGVFHVMKYMGEHVELITELAKDATYAGDTQALSNQFYLCANQEMRQYRLRGQTDWAVTDSPLLQQGAYVPQEDAVEFFSMALHLVRRYDNFNVLVKRSLAKYQQSGRNETLTQAKRKDAIIADIFSKQMGRTPSLVLDSGPNSVRRIVQWLATEVGFVGDIPTIPEFDL